jgi:hypothetical protein
VWNVQRPFEYQDFKQKSHFKRALGAFQKTVQTVNKVCHGAPMPIISPIPLNPLIDGRQSERAMLVRRGVQRLLREMGAHVLPELSLATGRRADLVALTRQGDIWIIEIKSSIEDFRADGKWQEYCLHADQFFFATGPHVPPEMFPPQVGLIVADPYGAEILRPSPCEKLPPARRKEMLIRIARCGALRLHELEDPECERGWGYAV